MSSKLQLTTLAVLVSAALPAQAALYKVVEVDSFSLQNQVNLKLNYLLQMVVQFKQPLTQTYKYNLKSSMTQKVIKYSSWSYLNGIPGLNKRILSYLCSIFLVQIGKVILAGIMFLVYQSHLQNTQMSNVFYRQISHQLYCVKGVNKGQREMQIDLLLQVLPLQLQVVRVLSQS